VLVVAIYFARSCNAFVVQISHAGLGESGRYSAATFRVKRKAVFQRLFTTCRHCARWHRDILRIELRCGLESDLDVSLYGIWIV